MTQAANRTKLYEWLTVSGMDSVAQDLRGVSLDRYPLLVVIIKEKGSYSVASVSFGKGPLNILKNILNT
jgi:hypothetical protein